MAVKKNTGDIPHTFWIQLSAQDPYGNWWYGDARSVYLQPGETSDWVCSIWDIPNNVPLGSYTASLDLAKNTIMVLQINTARAGANLPDT